LLSGINLVAAVPLILMLEGRDAQNIRSREENTAFAEREAAAKGPALEKEKPAKADTESEEETISFNPCGLWVHYSAQEEAVRWGELPAFVMTGWRIVCPPKWTFSGMMHLGRVWAPTTATSTAQRQIDASLCILIALQWLLVGALPLKQTQKWWGEPGFLITACNVFATCLALIPAVEGLARLPALIAAYAWLWWFGLLIWVMLRLVWKRIARQLMPHFS